MTSQISDILHWNGEDYAIAAVENLWSFDPEEYGLKPQMLSTACWRGFHCTYEVRDQDLLLRAMVIGLHNHDAPVFQGRRGVKDVVGSWHFEDLLLPILYSGGVLVGRDFQDEFYVHMGFHRPHCYGRLYELCFEKGLLVRSKDLSDKMAELRDSIRRRQRSPASAKPMPESQSLNTWIRDCFSLDYGVKKDWD